MLRRVGLLLCLSLLVATPRARATTILFGTPGDGGNAFPFGGGVGGPNISTRYQQVYDNALFQSAVSGPILITGITFFDTLFPGGTFATSTYTLRLSTSRNPVNSLDTTNFQNNVGADSALFGVFPLSGPVPASSFTLSGAPFFYNPAAGDLLLDITTPANGNGNLTAFLDAMNETFGADSSRAHNYGAGFEEFGLVTQFTFAADPVPEPATMMLTGVGVAALVRRARRGRKSGK